MEMFRIGSLGDALLRAFGKAAVDARTRLHAAADAAIIKHGATRQAAASLRGSVNDDPALLVEILEEISFLDPLLRTFIERRAAALKASGSVIPVGQKTPDAHSDGAHGNPDSRAARPGDEPPAGPPPHDTQGDHAGGGTNGRAGQSAAGNHLGTARPATNKPRGLAQMKGAASLMRNHILDRLTVNGQPLRAVTAGEAIGAAEVMSTNAATIMRICTGLKPDVPVGDQLSDGEAEARAALS